MAEPTSITLTGDLGKPANTLVEKIFAAGGGLFAPWQTKRLAKAEVAASLIRAKGEIDKQELVRRAAERFVGEEVKKQENVEAVIEEAIPLLKDDARPDQMDDDWTANFTDKAKLTSTDEMRKLLAKILAGQANTPGTFSKRAVNIANEFDKNDAQLFRSVCQFGWQFGFTFTPVVFDVQHDAYTSRGINFAAMNHLDEIGLLSFSHLTGFLMRAESKQFVVAYADQFISVELPQNKRGDFVIGQVLLSQAGRELAPVIDSQVDISARDAVIEYWRSKSYKVKFLSTRPTIAT